MSDFEGNELV